MKEMKKNGRNKKKYEKARPKCRSQVKTAAQPDLIVSFKLVKLFGFLHRVSTIFMFNAENKVDQFSIGQLFRIRKKTVVTHATDFRPLSSMVMNELLELAEQRGLHFNSIAKQTRLNVDLVRLVLISHYSHKWAQLYVPVAVLRDKHLLETNWYDVPSASSSGWVLLPVMHWTRLWIRVQESSISNESLFSIFFWAKFVLGFLLWKTQIELAPYYDSTKPQLHGRFTLLKSSIIIIN